MKKRLYKNRKTILILVLIIIAISIFIYHKYIIESDIFQEEEHILSDGNESNTENKTTQDIIFPNTIILKWPEDIIDYNNVTFTWTGEDDLTKIENILYSYKLEGYTNKWSLWDRETTITYIDLPNAEYTFFVKAKDQAGNIDPIPVEEFFIINVSNYKPEFQSYYVYWPVCKSYFSLDNPFNVEKKQCFQKTFTFNQYNLKQITFQLSWEDDITTPLFHFGKDRLIFTVKSDKNTILYTEKSVGKGTLSFNIADINDKPNIQQIEAEDFNSAHATIKQYFGSNLMDETFDVFVELKIGEIRILPRIREKGNDFILNVSYEYYNSNITIVKDYPPETSIISGPSGSIEDRNVEFFWTGSDDFTTTNLIKYSYKLDPNDKTWSEWTSKTSINYEDLDIGSYTFYVKSKDKKDNVDQTPAERIFTIKEIETDRTPPTIEILTGPSGIIKDTAFTFTWTGKDDKTPSQSLRYRYKLEGKDGENIWSSWNSITKKEYRDIFNGKYKFMIEVRDGSSNCASTERSFNVEQWDLNRFVTKILYFTGTGNIDKIKGVPHGCGLYCGCKDSILTLGNNGCVTVGFNVIIRNGNGYDFIIFENPFMIFEDDEEVFAELFYVEVSTDNISFARFPSKSLTAEPVYNRGININNVSNLGGVHPVLSNAFENNLNPFNPQQAGGDPFDLDDLLDDTLVQDGLVDLDNINYVRLIDIPGDGSCFDSFGNPIYDPTEPNINGADIDAISIINYKT